MSDMTQALQGVCVLLVEDEPGLQEVFALVLELEGAEVMRANDGREALECLTKARPDLVVTDYMMPRMNGLQLITQIRAQPRFGNVPILLLSAALPKQVDASIANVFLPKPVSVKQLIDTALQLTRNSAPE